MSRLLVHAVCVLSPRRRLKLPDVATYERLEKTIKSIRANFTADSQPIRRAELGHLQRVLLGLDNPNAPEKLSGDAATESVVDLNATQQEALKHAVENELTLVFGPPGSATTTRSGPESHADGPNRTGKTHTLISIITKLVQQGNRVLVASASNLAVGKSSV